jgi:membrane-associated protein
MPFHLDLVSLIKTIGYIGLFFMVFAESGLFFGFFFPGDSLLFTAGFLASQGIFSIYLLIPLLVIAAIGGDSAGFWTGKKLSAWLLKKRETWYYRKRNLVRAQEFYAKHGGKTLILARFIPAVRTFVPIAAGIADMKYSSFITYNILGGTGWAVIMLLAGYFLGKTIPSIDKYMLPIVFVIIIVSAIPAVIEVIKGSRHHKVETVEEPIVPVKSQDDLAEGM